MYVQRPEMMEFSLQFSDIVFLNDNLFHFTLMIVFIVFFLDLPFDIVHDNVAHFVL